MLGLMSVDNFGKDDLAKMVDTIGEIVQVLIGILIALQINNL
jgi:hypothetical protein